MESSFNEFIKSWKSENGISYEISIHPTQNWIILENIPLYIIQAGILIKNLESSESQKISSKRIFQPFGNSHRDIANLKSHLEVIDTEMIKKIEDYITQQINLLDPDFTVKN